MSESMDPVDLVEGAATRVRDPVSGRSVWLAGMVTDRKLTDGGLVVEVTYTEDHEPEDRKSIEAAIEANLRGMGYEDKLLILPAGARPTPPKKIPGGDIPGLNSGGGMAPHGGAVQLHDIGVKRVIAVASGKGGVGKSTLATNLAIGLQQQGYKVGLLDADVFGPSVQVMMNVHARPMVDGEGRILPVNAYGVRCLSMGMVVDESQAMIWRGPMVAGAVRDFIQKARWDGLDYLVVDLPPGTGEVQLTLIQGVKIDGAVVVTTPQKVALADAVRGITMFEKLDVPIVGLVENMAYYELPDGSRDYVFGEGGGLRTAERYGTEVLGQIPLNTSVRKGGDSGLPQALDQGELGDRFRSIAKRVAEKLPLEA